MFPSTSTCGRLDHGRSALVRSRGAPAAALRFPEHVDFDDCRYCQQKYCQQKQSGLVLRCMIKQRHATCKSYFQGSHVSAEAC